MDSLTFSLLIFLILFETLIIWKNKKNVFRGRNIPEMKKKNH